jgi:hypothetical protein
MMIHQTMLMMKFRVDRMTSSIRFLLATPPAASAEFRAVSR